MTYPTLMVHLELGKSNAGLLNIAGDLAGRFRAGVIGVAACQPMQIPYGDVYYSGDLIEQDRRTDDKDAAEAEAEFRALLGPRVTDLHWRSAITMEPLCDYFAREARAADLILTAMDRRSLDGDSRRTNIGDLVMRAGRPVLIVPGDGEQLKLDRVFVAWKETREARRAILDALPLLRIASHVTLVEVAQEDDLAAARAQRAGAGIGHIAHFLRHAQHRAARFRIDHLRRIENPRNSGDGQSRAACNLGDAHGCKRFLENVYIAPAARDGAVTEI